MENYHIFTEMLVRAEKATENMNEFMLLVR